MSVTKSWVNDTLSDLFLNISAGRQRLESVNDSVDFVWVFWGMILVFFMEVGFAMLEAGSVRTWNVSAMLFKNSFDPIVVCLMYWSVGHSLAYGVESESSFIGSGNFFLSSISPGKEAHFLQSWAFASTAATIVSGAVAERCTLVAYFIFVAFLSMLIYPVVVHWAWSSNGWMSPFNNDVGSRFKTGVIDFAGSGVVHMVGGFCSLMGCVVLGPRIGTKADEGFGFRFGKNIPEQQFYPHSIPLQAMGTFFLWFSWYGFNASSTGQIASGSGELVSHIMTTTALGGAVGGLSAALTVFVITRRMDPSVLFNGILAGLVSVTAGCSVTEPWAAIFISFIGGMVYVKFSNIIKYFKIDDPLDAFPIHGACGTWGILAAGVFVNSDNAKLSGYPIITDGGYYDQGGGSQFTTQLLFAFCVVVWTSLISFVIFKLLMSCGILRVSPYDEYQGLDVTHGLGRAYQGLRQRFIPDEIVCDPNNRFGFHFIPHKKVEVPIPCPLDPKEKSFEMAEQLDEPKDDELLGT